MLTSFRDQEEVSRRPAVLSVLGAMLIASRATPSFPADVLSPYSDELLSILTSSLSPLATRGQALAALVQLAQLPSFLLPDEVTFITQSLTELVTSNEVEHADAALEGISTIAKLYPRIIEQHALPPLFTRLPDSAPTEVAQLSELRLTLSSLAQICTSPDLFEVLSMRLLARIERSASTSPATPAETHYTHLLLTTLRLVLERKATQRDGDIPKYIDRLVPGLFGIFLAPALKTMDEGEVAAETRLLSDAGRVMMVVVQSLDERCARLASCLAPISEIELA